METKEILDIAEAGGGMVTTAQVVAAGIPRARITDMVRSGVLERVQRGVYCLAGSWEDEFLATQLRFPKGVFSDGTALYLHDSTDRTPFRLTMTFPRSYRATSAREAGIEVRTCADAVLGLGLSTLGTPYGNEVRAYDLERTLCDLVRGRSVVDAQVFNPAIKQYVRSKDRDIQKLLEYARALGVEGKIRGYLEVLL
ncbi:type IV toxin-antitoxin system AbiEi family antitoxin domain-containing protein [Adlercreutzia sp. ZJ473]|uniref:type IV toxin-antitoxin system AbiEi family antitoxin domain-containing protein n=1 Tax=Adlercreutzia sp. ZJ473 TaxID=2722822 RepID=UPI00155807F6|nr:type IV toxin-antitoxin system AbiEi family antitoxin domain-containing protein [Adlercreutzia sp. ZJ473]